MPRLKKPLEKKDIERAMLATRSNKAAARHLRVSYETYKKYAQLYTNDQGITLFDQHLNKSGIGIPRLKTGAKVTGLAIADVLSGKISGAALKPRIIKERILSEGLKPEECDRCGFNQKRQIDQKVPLIFSFKDFDKTNWTFENIELLCHNCYYLNIGDVYMQKQIDSLEFYDSLISVEIDFELPEQHAENIKKQMNLQNFYVNDSNDEEEYGSDLIAYNR